MDFTREDIKEVISVAALFHDFGKATCFFQEYILDPKKPSTDIMRKRRSHGLVSAIITYQILKEKFGNDSILPAFGFIIVRKHHGNLENYKNLLTICDADLHNCQIQAQNADYQEYQQIVKDYKIDINLFENFDYSEFRGLRRKDRDFSTEHYFVLNLLYSNLLHADKTDAILREMLIPEQELFSGKNITNYRKNFENNPENLIDNIRERAFLSAEQTIDFVSDSERIFSINIPTGAGKTINSLNAAVKLCEKFGHKRVIYCLPFTSVIDQNFRVFENIASLANMPDDSGILLKHHYLTDIRYKSVSDEEVIKEYMPNESLHLIEGWESRVIVTTFVQLMYSLFSYKNASLRKFQRLSNAVIILDEVQSIPHHYWNVIKTMLTTLADKLYTRIILVTATMPLIFSEHDNEIKELVPEKQQHFAALNRIELDITNLKSEKMDWADFCAFSKQVVDDHSSKDILFILNTVRSAKELFQLFSDNKTTPNLKFLSAHVIPKHRLERIEAIQMRDKNQPALVVSTQLVEAGVDIDLDIVVRDFAPLDSIFQACGRCNRENRNGVKGQIFLVSVKDSNGWETSGIYSQFLRQKTKRILEGKTIIEESEFFPLAQDYFFEVQTDGSQRQSLDLFDKIEKLKYADGKDKIELELIDDDFTSSVFIEFDDQAKESWKNYQYTLNMENSFEKKSQLKQAQRQLAEYIINIPKKCLPDGYDEGIYRISKDDINQYYNPITGFDTECKLPNKTETAIF